MERVDEPVDVEAFANAYARVVRRIAKGDRPESSEATVDSPSEMISLEAKRKREK